MSDTETQPNRAWSAALAAFAVALVVYLVAGQVTSFGFVNYDDVDLVSPANPAIGKGLAAGIAELLSPARTPQFMHAWLPLYYASAGIDHALGRGAPWVFHLHSAILHAVAAAMVALLARRLGMRAFVAGLAGVIFAVHPVATESVAWVASRKDVLSFVWMAAAAIFYLDGIEKRRPGLHVLGALCLLVSMTAKGTTLVLPLLLAVHAILLRDDESSVRERLRPVTPYAVVAGLMTALHLWVASREGTAGGGTGAGLGAILVADLQVVWRYAIALCVPFKQSVEHGLSADAVDTRQAVLGAAVIVVWTVAVGVTWKRSRGAAAALLAVPLALLPFNNVLPRTSVLFAERYVYVALLPFAIGVAWLLRRRGDGAMSMLPSAVGVGVLATLCAMRLPVWHDSVTLWQDAESKAPQSALVQLKLAAAFTTRAQENSADVAEDWARAERAWRAAAMLSRTERSPLNRGRAEHGLATHLYLTHAGAADAEGLREALTHFDAAESSLSQVEEVGRAETLADLLSNRASCKQLLGDIAGATRDYEAAVRMNERCAIAWNGLARVYLIAGRTGEVREALAKSEKAAPHDPAIVRERAKVRLVAGDGAGARRDLADAIAAHPLDTDLLVDAARLDAMWLRPVDAETKLRKAMELRPGDASIKDLLAASLLDQAQSQAARDDMGAAREAARKAAEIVPMSSAPEQVLGIVARRAGKLDEAAAHLRKARDLHPEGVRIREQLASVLAELAVELLDEKREGLALILLEEAVQTRAAAIATPQSRLDTGVADWPDPVPGDDRAAVARSAALRGLAYLGVGRAKDALREIVIAEAGTRDGDVRLRRVVLRLLIRARFALGLADEAVAASGELPSIEIADDAEWTWRRHAERASAFVERGIGRRGGTDVASADADFVTAREALDAAHAAGMPEWRLHTRRGEILFAEEDFLAATKAFDKAEELAPNEVEPLLDRAEVWRTQFLLEEDNVFLLQAEHDLRRAAAVAPGDPRVLARLGETLVFEQKPGDAFPWLQKAVLADPSQAMARKLLADLAIRAGRNHLEKCAGAAAAVVQQELAEAKSAADRAVALDPPSPDALVFLGDVLRAQGDWKLPLAKYELARDRFPESAAPRDAIAKFHMDRGHFYLLYKKRSEAIADFKKALDVPGATIDLAAAKDRLHEIAGSAFAEAQDLDKAGRFDEAAERLAQSLFAEPTAVAHFARGVVLAKSQKLEDAAPQFEAALKMDPTMIAARINRAAVLERLGQLDAAMAEYRAWLDAAPADAADRAKIEKHAVWLAKEIAEIEKESPK